jgi:hypothetical protein
MKNQPRRNEEREERRKKLHVFVVGFQRNEMDKQTHRGLSISICSAVICSAFALLLLSFSVGARQAAETKKPPPIPILPLLVEYEYAPLYLMQWIDDHPQYSMIEAIVHQTAPPLYQVILTEKETRRRVYYCNLKAKALELARDGREAHAAVPAHRRAADRKR